MTDRPGDSSPKMLRFALRALPSGARRDQEAELAAIYVEATTGAGPRTQLREALDVVGYGLRLRCGLGGQGRADAIVARAVPMAVVLCAAQGIPYLGPLVATLLYPDQLRGAPASYLVMLGLAAAATVAWFAVLALVLGGRWGAARALGTIATLAQTPALLLAAPGMLGGRAEVVSASLLPSVFVWLLLLAAPRDLLGRPSQRDRRAVAGVGLLAVAPFAAILLLHDGRDVMPLIAFMWFVPVLLAILFARRAKAGPAAVGTAALGLASFAGILRFGVMELVTMSSARTVEAGFAVLAVVALGWWFRPRSGTRRGAVSS